MTLRSKEKRFTWQDAPDLMARLTKAQNRLRTPIDIMTFAGFCESRAELERHVVRYEEKVASQPAPKARRRYFNSAEREQSERQGDRIDMYRREI